MRKTLTTLALGATLALSLSACGGDETINSSDRNKASKAALAAVGGGTVTDADLGDGDDGYAFDVEVVLPNGEDVDVELDADFKVTNNPPTISDFATPEVVTSTTPAPRSTDNDDDAPLTGSTLTNASAAALKAAGGGKVTETSRSDDADHVYEVEITFTNGDDLTVELNKDFGVTKIDR